MPSPPVAAAVSELLSAGRAVTFHIRGSSMSPFLRAGDLVTLEIVRDGDLRIGTLVAVRAEEEHTFLVHRLVARRADGRYLTRGDAAPTLDPAVDREAIIGQVTTVRRNGRRIRCGLGPEGRAIAFLSRRGWLLPALLPLRRARRLFGLGRWKRPES